MNVTQSFCIAVGIIGLSGCQLTTSQPVSHTFNDPVPIHDYQLPVFPQGMTSLGNYRQQRNQDIWYWTELENHTFQRGENLIVQVIANKPLSQPPAQFSFSLPANPGERKYNSIGAYQHWVSVMPNGDRCTYSQQHTKRMNKYLSIFIHHCAPEDQHNLSWLDNLKPSFFLEER
ncbi:hypothetical protein [Photobacterium aquae]|nr:hypothetical protein [Photobacterium aquae]